MAEKITINTRSNKHCGICTFWHDPACTVLEHKQGDFWFMFAEEKRLCLRKKIQKKAWHSCTEFVCKF